MSRLCVAVTGLNATDNPGPGVAVIRAIRAAAGDGVTVIGLGYDALDPGAYVAELADHVYLVPYPSQGSDTVYERLAAIHATTPIDVLIPTLDAELPVMVKLADRLAARGMRTFLPDAEQLQLRAKDRLGELRDRHGLCVPRSFAISSPREIAAIDQQLRFPVMVKGHYYDAYVAHSAYDVHTRFHQLAAAWGLPVVVQEFIAGDEYDVVALGDGEGGLVGSVPMRKMQLTDKGKAWGGVTIAEPQLDQLVRDAIERLRWRGPCELEIIRDRDRGEAFIIEINPRFPAWVYLTVGADRNLPWATVRLALGERVAPMAPAPAGVMFLRYARDYLCTLSDYEALATTGELHREASPLSVVEVSR